MGAKAVNGLLSLVLVATGFFVAGVSLYLQSMSNVYAKMGLGAVDYTGEVENVRLSEELDRRPSDDISCGVLAYLAGLRGYNKSLGLERGVRAIVLGERRVVCGVELVARGRVKWGTYVLVKGLRYLEEGTEILGPGLCEGGGSVAAAPIIRASWYLGAFFDAASGQVRDAAIGSYGVLLSRWREMQCLDAST